MMSLIHRLSAGTGQTPTHNLNISLPGSETQLPYTLHQEATLHQLEKTKLRATISY